MVRVNGEIDNNGNNHTLDMINIDNHVKDEPREKCHVKSKKLIIGSRDTHVAVT